MKIIPSKKKYLFEINYDGIKYVSVKKKHRGSCIGCILYRKYSKICEYIHDVHSDNFICANNDIIFIKE